MTLSLYIHDWEEHLKSESMKALVLLSRYHDTYTINEMGKSCLYYVFR